MPGVWADQLDPEGLAQGDVLERILFALPVSPDGCLTPVQRDGTIQPGIWRDSDQWRADHQGIGDCRARGRLGLALVISHSCEIDKPTRNARVLAAPIRPATQLAEGIRQQVMAGGPGAKLAIFPLPLIPGFGDGYADLRQITSIERSRADGTARLGSLTKAHLKELRRRLAWYFSRDEEPTTARPADTDTAQQ